MVHFYFSSPIAPLVPPVHATPMASIAPISISGIDLFDGDGTKRSLSTASMSPPPNLSSFEGVPLHPEMVIDSTLPLEVFVGSPPPLS